MKIQALIKDIIKKYNVQKEKNDILTSITHYDIIEENFFLVEMNLKQKIQLMNNLLGLKLTEKTLKEKDNK